MLSEIISLPVVIALAQQLMYLVLLVKDRKEAFKPNLERLQLTLMLMGPLFEAGGTWCSNERVLKEIKKKLEAGNVLVEKCQKLPCGSVWKCCYSRKISKLDADLFRFCQQELIVENYLTNRRILNKVEKLSLTAQQSSILAQTPLQLEKLSTFTAKLHGGKQGSESHSTSDLTRVPVLVDWSPPPSGFLKYNVNGVRHENPAPAAGIGGVCRDANGIFINCFHKGVGNSNALEAEALAIREGLLVAAGHDHLRIYIESSSEMIINILTQFGASSPDGVSSSIISLECPTEISVIITEILNLQDHFEKVFFCRTSKEGNYVAASLSSTAAIHSSPKFWDYQPPDSIASTLYSDAWGVFNL